MLTFYENGEYKLD